MAGAFIVIFVVLDLAVLWPAKVSLITLGEAYGTATSDQRVQVLAAAGYPSAVLDSDLTAVYSILTLGIGILGTGLVMLRGRIERTAAIVGVATGVLSIASVVEATVTRRVPRPRGRRVAAHDRLARPGRSCAAAIPVGGGRGGSLVVTGHARGYPCTMPAEFIYTSYKLARHYPPDRTVLEDISISFYPGAKIGVIGPNGAGKSSLLRIMAGLDDGFIGEARLTPGFTVGYLEPGAAARPGQGREGQRHRRRPRASQASSTSTTP